MLVHAHVPHPSLVVTLKELMLLLGQWLVLERQKAQVLELVRAQGQQPISDDP